MASTELPAVLQAVVPIVNQYGYFAVGGLLILEDLGLPVPGETVLTTAAVLAGAGQLNPFILGVVAIICCVIGDNIGFAVGHYGGETLLKRYGRYVFMNEEKIKSTHKFFNKYGALVVIVARFIEGLRQLNGIIAGSYGMKWVKFLTFNIIGATLWVSLWVFLGTLAGNNIEPIYKKLTMYGIYGLIAIVVLLAGWFIYRRVLKMKHPKNT